jgi:4-hydroxybenzoate polyprenyltransferase
MEIDRREALETVLRVPRPVLTVMILVGMAAGTASVGGLNLENLALAVFLSVTSCYSVFGINDYYDRETDEANERKGGIQGEVAAGEKQEVVKYSAVLGTLLFLGSAILFSGLARYAVLGITVFSLAYSVPPVKLKGRPPLDSISNGFWVFSVFAAGVGLGGGNFSSIIPGAYWFSAIVAGAHAVASLPDIEADREAGIKTTGMLLGWRPTVSVLLAIILSSFLFVNWSTVTTGYLLGSAAILSTMLLKPDSQRWHRSMTVFYVFSFIYGVYWIIRKTGLELV